MFLIYSLKLLPYFFQADFIHFFSDYPHCTFFSFIPKTFKPRFITVHGTYGVAPLDNKKSRLILERAFKVAKKIICVSGFTKEQILKRVALDNLVVINNGINLEKFENNESGEKLPFPMVLSVGNLKHRKGYHVSIPAIAKVKQQIPNVKYYIVASKPDKDYNQQLQKLIKENNLKDSIVFFHNLTDQELLKLYYQADLFLLTPVVISGNKFEGFGLVYLEASACGKPVIGTKDCGAQDAIKENYNGLLVEQNNIDQTAQAIIRVLSDSNLASKLGENGRQWVKKFDWHKIVNNYREIYNS